MVIQSIIFSFNGFHTNFTDGFIITSSGLDPAFTEMIEWSFIFWKISFLCNYRNKIDNSKTSTLLGGTFTRGTINQGKVHRIL